MNKPFQERILVVDDEKIITDKLMEILIKEGIVECTGNGEEALNKLYEDYCAVIICDIGMPVMDGIEFYNRAVKMYPSIKDRFIFHVSDSDLKKHISFFEKNNLKYVNKNLEMKTLKKIVADILNQPDK
ncbi:MAG: response regulator [Deltaproteobacteria bacterium]|nr:response regulator [Deltaproteobacteria bacterium]